jgi:crotonobetainyl-CoA:carnitine CoA-transferase CaiB-like acyl-CoA transferase
MDRLSTSTPLRCWRTAFPRHYCTGSGPAKDSSLACAAALAMQSGRFMWAEKEGRDVGRDLRSLGVTGIHPTKQGEIYISANTPHFWQALCELIGLPELAQDPEYDTVRKRAHRAGELVPKMRAALASRTALEWEERFGERVPCCAVRPIEDMFDHPQVLAEGLVAEFDHKTVGRYRGAARPLELSASCLPEPFAAPALGQHTDEVLTFCGYSPEELDELRKRKVIGDVTSMKR